MLSSPNKLHWKEYGLARGQAVIYLHGVPGSSLDAQSAHDIACQLNIRLIAADLPGFGHSNPLYRLDLLNFPEHISHLADDLNFDKFSILGFSAGGPFALACAHELKDRVSHVALVSSLAPFESSVMQKHVNADFKPLYDLAMNDHALAMQQIALMAPSSDVLQTVMEAPLSDVDKVLLHQPDFRKVHLQSLQLSLKQGVIGIVDALRAVRLPWPFLMSDIDTRVDIWQGGEDVIVNQVIGQYLHQQLTGSHYHFFPTGGHYLLFNHWKEILSCFNSDS